MINRTSENMGIPKAVRSKLLSWEPWVVLHSTPTDLRSNTIYFFTFFVQYVSYDILSCAEVYLECKQRKDHASTPGILVTTLGQHSRAPMRDYLFIYLT